MIKPIEGEEEERPNRHFSRGPSHIGTVLGVILILIVFGVVGMNSLKTISKSSVSVVVKPSVPSVVNKKEMVKFAEKTGASVGTVVLQTGKQLGAEVLGMTVNFVQKNASKSADAAANAAANIVIKSAVPAIVDQINKLPDSQKKEVKQIICK